MTCRECAAAITVSDRFCPACGTPNLDTKFQPKFAPALRILEPRIVTEPAPTGAPSCPRCHRLVARPQGYCRGCGMDLDEAWERYHRVQVIDDWKRQPGHRLEVYRSPAVLARVVNAVLVAGVVVALAMGLANLWLYARFQGLLTDGPGDAAVGNGLDAATNASVAVFALGLLLLIVWMRRCYRNLPPLAVGDLRFDPAWAVWGWLVPGFNLFRPKQILDDIWRGSHPMAPPFSSSWRVGPASAWSTGWWATLLLGGFLGLTSHFFGRATADGCQQPGRRPRRPAPPGCAVGLVAQPATAGPAGHRTAGDPGPVRRRSQPAVDRDRHRRPRRPRRRRGTRHAVGPAHVEAQQRGPGRGSRGPGPTARPCWCTPGPDRVGRVPRTSGAD